MSCVWVGVDVQTHLSICSVCSLFARKPNTTTHTQTNTIYLPGSLWPMASLASPLLSLHVVLCTDSESMFAFLWCLQLFFFCFFKLTRSPRLPFAHVNHVCISKWVIKPQLKPFKASEQLLNLVTFAANVAVGRCVLFRDFLFLFVCLFAFSYFVHVITWTQAILMKTCLTCGLVLSKGDKQKVTSIHDIFLPHLLWKVGNTTKILFFLLLFPLVFAKLSMI